MADEAISKVVYLVIPLLVLAIIGFLTYGLLGKGFTQSKNVAEGFVPEEVSTNLSVAIPDNQRIQINQLRATMESMIGEKKDCFANYGGFPSLEGGASIVMSYNKERDATDVVVRGGTGGQQIVTDLMFSIPKMKPCVIAGQNGIVAQNFFTKFIEKKSVSDVASYYLDVENIVIKYSTEADSGFASGIRCTNGNRIMINDLSQNSNVVNDQCNNLEDGGYIFTPDGSHVCFFPTNNVNNNDEDGIDNDYIFGNEDNSISNQYARGELTKC